jgi:hypothetical protein
MYILSGSLENILVIDESSGSVLLLRSLPLCMFLSAIEAQTGDPVETKND